MDNQHTGYASDDSDFDELDDIDTPDFVDGSGDVEPTVQHTSTAGVRVEFGKGDQQEGKLIPFSSIHRPAKGFQNVRPDCWMKEPIHVRIPKFEREDHPHMTRKAFNPNLYTIEVRHGDYVWTFKRRYKHFDSLHKSLRLFRARCSLPVPTKQHREQRQSFREERKERKIKKKQKKVVVGRFPKKPEIMVREEQLEKRRRHLEAYLQSVVESKWYRNHTEVLKFLEVSELSFVNRLGQKWKEADINKCSGGRRISIGCCGCLKKYHVAGRWSKRWLVLKDTFIAYIRPRDGCVCDVMLMDSGFKVHSGMGATGAPHGLLVQNMSRHLLAKSWTSRKADEWEESIKNAADTTGQEFIQNDIRYGSYAPVRENSYARWFVDGASYFEAVAEALEKAKEEIFITDWWLSPEIYLKRFVTDREKWRLDEVLARRAKDGVKVFVILYKEMETALTINSHYSKHALMNRHPNIKVIRHPDHVATSNRVLLWAHHEKVVVIDQKTAFLGGFDLCYGRWDDDQHRMTDLGSVSFTPLSKPTPADIGFPQNGSAPRHRTIRHLPRQPSTIAESPESNMADSGIYDEAGNQIKESIGDSFQSNNNSQEEKAVGNTKRLSNGQAGKCASAEDLSVTKNVPYSSNRYSSCSEREYGSADVLTDNDSLETVDKIGYHNIVAEVTVHSHGAQDTGEVADHSHVDQDIREGAGHSQDTGNTPHSPVCNVINSDGDDEISDNNSLPFIDDGAVNVERGVIKLEKEHSDDRKSVDVDEIQISEDMPDSFREHSTDLEKIEEQIISCDNVNNDKISSDTNGIQKRKAEVCNQEEVKAVHVDEVSAEMPSDLQASFTDQNKNQTKASVRFREGGTGEIEEEHIAPVTAGKLHATPSRKDAASRRETWASRKLRKTFKLKDKNEDEDQPDGKDKSEKSDSDDESSGHKFRNKWRMVLNIKKLEHGGKRPEDEESIPPGVQSPHQSLSARIVSKIPFRASRQDSDDDFQHFLYPWKRLFRRDDSAVMVKSVMKTSVADDYEGLEGSSKLWIGKDYINFIHKDPVDVHNPFEDFIERDKTPRMPWHDVGGVVYGKAARDVARHFILRWNFCKTEKFKSNKEFPILMPKTYAKCEVSPAIKDITYSCTTQILRSVCGWSAGINRTEQSIHQAYLDCIKRAKHYIYIENQFFISQIGDHSMVRNEISEALLERIVRAHKLQEMFRVYVVLPLLPAFEGEIGATGGYSIQAVLHWNYMSISKGDNSLWQQLAKRVDDPKKYILFCGLRSHDELKGKLVTELVYVHSKLMIVDDDTVIIGSANINDRSMIGSRDSEIAVVVEDTDKFPVKLNGKDHMAGKFATSLRRTLFREHLGIKEDDFHIDLSDPVCDKFYKNVWLTQASINTTIYHKVFKCIPDDRIKSFSQIKEMAATPSLAETDKEAARQELKKVKGRIVFLPLYFLENEVSLMASGAQREAVMPTKLWT
ncbi:phospholipase D1-like isoform X3 [Mya arenaria]|uniref:phospholipase D1-like isoform X3 n=1 Tax=Mya arenaria TaxID=6604 RepID=UPI0022E4E1BB|nr:phospholipase D1-like isoform X3 [Mya arenaria]